MFVAGGPFVLGVDAVTEPFSLDNERPAHTVDVAPFWIGRVPVSNRQWREFIADGGYDRRDLWSGRGWEHRTEAGLERPKFWTADGTRRRFGIEEDVPPDEPVQHICFFEAEAFATWAGARLPTETEWEKACAWDPGRRGPGGPGRGGPQPPTADRVNIGGTALRPAPVGAYPAGASAYGAEQMIGDVWEWTSSDFVAVAGVRADDLPPVQRAVLRRRLQGAARRVLGGGPGRHPALVPQLGSPDPAADFHRPEAGLGSGERGGRLSCAGTSPGWARRARLATCCSPRNTGCWCSHTPRDGSVTAG